MCTSEVNRSSKCLNRSNKYNQYLATCRIYEHFIVHLFSICRQRISKSREFRGLFSASVLASIQIMYIDNMSTEVDAYVTVLW